MLKVEGISLSYKKHRVIEEVSFSVEPGQVVGLLGANGSGKSTLLSAVAGAKKPDAGIVTLFDIDQAKQRDAYRAKVGYVPQENPLIDELTCLDNLRIFSPLSGAEIKALLEQPPLAVLGVAGYIDKKVSGLSGGMKKRLSLAETLIRNPELLLLDEPFAALDLVAKYDIMSYIISYKQAGGMVLVASHEEAVLSFCDRVYFVNHGKLFPIDRTKQVSYVELLRGAAPAFE